MIQIPRPLVSHLGVVCFVCKVVCLGVLMSLNIGAFAWEEPRFFIEVDMAYAGIRVGQETELTYSCTVPFDSVILPEFGEGIGVVRGPEPSRVMSVAVTDGEKKQVSRVSYSFYVRFLSEGIVSLPVASVKVGGREYHTPPLCVRVKPALRDTAGVECRLSASVPPSGKGGTLRVTLFCNRRPDQRSPLLVADGRKYEPGGRSSGFSPAKDTTGGKPGGDAVKEWHEFYYNLPSDGRKACLCSVENLSFGGVPYAVESREMKGGTLSANREGLLVVAVMGVLLIFGGMWLRFRKEAREDMAAFVLRHKRLNLSTEWALTHYAFPLFLGSIPFFFLLFNGYGYVAEGRQDWFFPWFWCGVLPLVVSFAFWRRQRLKLDFQAVPTSLSPGMLREVMEKAARENNWTLDYIGEDCIVARTHRRWWEAARGEQVFLVFGREEVWINSVNDLHKRSVTFPSGYTKRNIRLLREAIESRE